VQSDTDAIGHATYISPLAVTNMGGVTVNMNQKELQAFCDMDDFARFQEKLNAATEADALNILSYLLAEGLYKDRDARLQILATGAAR